MKRGILLLIFSLFLIGLVSSATCGDGTCDAGYNLDGTTVEDSSTCYKDCGDSMHYTVCKVDTISGGSCEIKGETYIISDVDFEGCGGMPSASASFTFSKGEHSINVPGLIGNSWIGTIDGISISSRIWPCSVYTSTKTFILRSSGEKANNFLEIDKTSFNLMEDNDGVFQYSVPEWLSKPYCRDRITNRDTGEEMTMREAYGCQSNTFIIENYAPGEYSLSAEIYDETANNVLGQDALDFIVHECQTNEECSDGNFLTKDACSDDEIKMCSSSTNITLIIIFVVVVIILIIILYLIFRKKG